MHNKITWKKSLPALIILIALLVIVYFLMGNTRTEQTKQGDLLLAEVTDLTPGACTDDVPPSDCGGARVVAQLSSGDSDTFILQGYSNGKGREIYNQNLNLLIQSYSSSNEVKIWVINDVIVDVARSE